MAEKPKLSEVVGALVASAAHARQVADVEAMRIAHLYLQNQLLKGMPVPRLRFRKVGLSIPVIMSEFVAAKQGTRAAPEAVAGPVSATAATAINQPAARIAALLTLKTQISGPPASPAEEREISDLQFAQTTLQASATGWNNDLFSTQFTEKLRTRYLQLDLEQGDTPAPDPFIRDTAGEVAEATFMAMVEMLVRKSVRATSPPPVDEHNIAQKVKQLLEDPRLQNAVCTVRTVAEAATMEEASVSPDFYVAVDTDSIKNAGGGPDTITRLDMVLLEEGLEWTYELRDGTKTARLVSE